MWAILIFAILFLIIFLLTQSDTISLGGEEYEMMTFPEDEYKQYKEMLDQGKESGTTRVWDEYGKYKIGHVYSTPKGIGHLVLVTRSMNLKM